MIYVLHNVGYKQDSNYNTAHEIKNAQGILTFDGVYRNVWENREILIGKDVYLFPMGQYVGRDNSFDFKQPREQLCSWNEIMRLVIDYKCKLGWHTWTHPDLTQIENDEQLRREITPPFPMPYFAYPYGKFNDRVIEMVKQAGFEKAFGVFDGNNTDYQLTRAYL